MYDILTRFLVLGNQNGYVYLYMNIYFYRFVYPTMDQLADQVLDVLLHFGLKRVIGFGVGAGANVLCRFALNNPEKVRKAINCTFPGENITIMSPYFI